MTPRFSTRSSYSVPDYETNDSTSRNNEQIEQAIQYHIKHVSMIIFLSPAFILVAFVTSLTFVQ